MRNGTSDGETVLRRRHASSDSFDFGWFVDGTEWSAKIDQLIWIFICTSSKIKNISGRVASFLLHQIRCNAAAYILAGENPFALKIVLVRKSKTGVLDWFEPQFGSHRKSSKSNDFKGDDKCYGKRISEHFSIPFFKITLVVNSAIARALHKFSCWRNNYIKNAKPCMTRGRIHSGWFKYWPQINVDGRLEIIFTVTSPGKIENAAPKFRQNWKRGAALPQLKNISVSQSWEPKES